jgi:transcriptional regulator with XRE-family HTH domain
MKEMEKKILPEIGERIKEARKKKFRTQEEMAEILGKALYKAGLNKNNDYSARQYQKVEAGEFPVFKGGIIKEIDKILNTKFYSEIYEPNIPHETIGNLSAHMHGSSSVTAKITGVNQEEVEKKQSIERSIELLIEDRGKVLTVIERLTALLERQARQGIQLDEPGTPGTETKKPAHV